MKTHELNSDIWLPQRPEDLFIFCSDMEMLKQTIPPWVHFHILTPGPIQLGLGTEVEYRLRLRGVPVRWRAAITAWDPPHRFVDEQVRGPYRLWVHEHLFEPHDGGVVCHDRVRYAHVGGWLVHRLLVRPDLERIWEHRLRKIREHFGAV